MMQTYSNAGVDTDIEDSSIATLISYFKSTHKNRKNKIGEVLDSTGHFANYIKFGSKFLVMSSDGVGSKVLIAQIMNKYDTVGIDMVAMNVNDIICVGAEPIALVDYLAVASHNTFMIQEIAKGIAQGANQAGIAIIGGETATLKEIIKGYGKNGFDLAGSCLGIVDQNSVVDGSKLMAGDFLVGIASSGIHSNGLTLARKILLKNNSVDDRIFDATIGEELLKPTLIYVKPILEVLDKCKDSIKAMYNITGSGFRKLRRLKKIGFRIEKLLPIPKVFDTIKEKGNISDEEMFKTFNMGIGFIIATNSPYEVLNIIRKNEFNAEIIGKVEDTKTIHIVEKKIKYNV